MHMLMVDMDKLLNHSPEHRASVVGVNVGVVDLSLLYHSLIDRLSSVTPVMSAILQSECHPKPLKCRKCHIQRQSTFNSWFVY